jgi:hypothetical protein
VTLDDPAYVSANAGKLVVYLGNRPFRSIKGTLTANPGEMVFQLRRTPENSADWSAILGAPDLSGTRSVALSVGREEGPPVGDAVLLLTVFQWQKVGIWSAFALVLLLIGSVIAAGTGILREGPEGPWSLSRCQLAFWTAVTFLSWLFLYIITGDYNLLTASTLGLMGISSATVLSAVAVDQSKKSGTAARVAQVLAEQAQLTPLAPAPGVAPATPLEKAAHARIQDNARAVTGMLQAPISLGLKADLLGADVRLHRIHLVLWTLALGAAFLFEVWRTMSIPEFSPSMLTLLGLSAAGYLGLKVPEAPKS